MKSRISNILIGAVALLFLTSTLSLAHDWERRHHKRHAKAFGHHKAKMHHPDWSNTKIKPWIHHPKQLEKHHRKQVRENDRKQLRKLHQKQVRKIHRKQLRKKLHKHMRRHRLAEHNYNARYDSYGYKKGIREYSYYSRRFQHDQMP